MWGFIVDLTFFVFRHLDVKETNEGLCFSLITFHYHEVSSTWGCLFLRKEWHGLQFSFVKQ